MLISANLQYPRCIPCLIAPDETLDPAHRVRILVRFSFLLEAIENHFGKLTQAETVSFLEIHLFLQLGHQSQGLLGQIIRHSQVARGEISRDSDPWFASLRRPSYAENVFMSEPSTRILLGKGFARSGRLLSSAFGFPPGQPVIVCWV